MVFSKKLLCWIVTTTRSLPDGSFTIPSLAEKKKIKFRVFFRSHFFFCPVFSRPWRR